MNKFNNLRFFLDGAVAPLWQRPALLQGLILMLLAAASTSLSAAEIRVLSGGAEIGRAHV